MDFISYFIAWFVDIALVMHHHESLAVGVILAITAIQIIWQIEVKEKWQGLFGLIIMLTILGSIIDTFFLHLNIIHFRRNSLMPYFSPPWMIVIWLNFSVLFYSVFESLFNRYFLLGIFSFIIFPLIYLSGVKLGAIHFPKSYWSIFDIGLAWSILLPMCMYFYNSWIRRDLEI